MTTLDYYALEADARQAWGRMKARLTSYVRKPDHSKPLAQDIKSDLKALADYLNNVRLLVDHFEAERRESFLRGIEVGKGSVSEHLPPRVVSRFPSQDEEIRRDSIDYARSKWPELY